jgi:hypothetical protein
MQALVTPTDRSVYSSAASTLGTFQLACDSEADPGALEVSFAPGAGDLIATTQAVAVLALDANTEPDEAPADDAGLVAPTAPCVAVADVLQPDETTTTIITDPTGNPLGPDSPGTDPTTTTQPAELSIAG